MTDIDLSMATGSAQTTQIDVEISQTTQGIDVGLDIEQQPQVIHGETLTGDGTSALPLDVAQSLVDKINSSMHTDDLSEAQWAAIDSGATSEKIGQISTNSTTINNHIGDTNNPHNVTKSQVGLGNVDNTSDLNKPISTAVQTALNAKVNSSDLAIVATTGSYTDLLNKPTIPSAQVNSDWNASSGVAEILNKPSLGTAAAANVTDFATAAQGNKADSAVQPGDLATVATTGSYSDLSNKPTIPTVNNSTITFTQGGVTKGSFTLNQSSNGTIALDAGGGSLNDMSDVTLTTPSSGQVLSYDGSKWVNETTYAMQIVDYTA